MQVISLVRRDQARAGRWLPAYAALAVIWGFSFLLIKVADRALAPLQVALGRVLLGALVVGAIMVVRRERLPLDRGTWLRLAIAALLMNTVPFTLLAYAEQRISSVDAGLWNATTPLLTLPATIWLIPSEKPGLRRVAGLLTGFGGVAILLGSAPRLDGRTLAGEVLCLGAACSYGLGFPFSRRFLSKSGLSPVALATGQLACATAELAVIVLPTTSAPAAITLPPAVSVLALGVAGTGIAYILNFTIVGAAGATVAATVTYVVPVCSTAAGVLVLGEHLRMTAVAGTVVVLAGAALARGGRKGEPSPSR